eukprot:gene12419-15166_t
MDDDDKTLLSLDETNDFILPNQLEQLEIEINLDKTLQFETIKHPIRFLSNEYCKKVSMSVDSFDIKKIKNRLSSLFQILFSENSFPQNVEELEFPHFLDKNNFKIIPKSVHTLISFGELHFDNRIDDPTQIIPPHINKKLLIGTIPDSKYTKLVPGIIPNGVKNLIIGQEYSNSIIPGVLPESIESLLLSGTDEIPFGSIPRSIRDISLQCPNINIVPGFFPDSCESLIFNRNEPNGLENLMLPSLKTLKFEEIKYGYNDKDIEGQLCSKLPQIVKDSLINLECADKYIKLPGTIPKGIRTLKLDCIQSVEIENGFIFDNLTDLSIYEIDQENFKKLILSSPNLTKLMICYYSNPLPSRFLPNSLKTIYLNDLTFKQQFPKDIFLQDDLSSIQLEEISIPFHQWKPDSKQTFIPDS